VNSIVDYLTDQLDYNYNMVQGSPENVDMHTVQVGLIILNQASDLAKQYHQAALADKLQKQFKDYENKFSPLLNRPQQ
jgi:hypothetical protein